MANKTFKVHTLAAAKTKKLTTKPAEHPVTIYRAHPLAWKEAKRLANGDATRLRVLADGSVMVYNR